MARNEAAKRRQGTRVVNGRVKPTRSASENRAGQYGNSKARDDKSVRRAREVENDPRLQRARAEQEEAERKLRHLESVMADQPHEAPNRWSQEADVAPLMEAARHMGRELAQAVERANDDIAAAMFAPKLRSVPDRHAMREAMDLLRQGYHVDRVAARTRLAVDDLRHLVGNDGYVR